MLNVYTVAFFGHRHVGNPFAIEQKLQKEIRELLSEKEYVEFLMGRNGEFDIMAAAAVRTAKREYRDDNSSLVLVLPYRTAEYKNNEKSFLNYYDEVEICEEASSAHFKSAITIRNLKLSERADCVLCYIERKSGGAYAAVKHANELGKRIINTTEWE